MDEMHPFPSLHLEILPCGLGRLDVTTRVAFMMFYLHFIICRGYLRGRPHLLLYFTYFVDKALGFPHIKRLALTFIFIITFPHSLVG
jgi:hypothetical protein